MFSGYRIHCHRQHECHNKLPSTHAMGLHEKVMHKMRDSKNFSHNEYDIISGEVTPDIRPLYLRVNVNCIQRFSHEKGTSEPCRHCFATSPKCREERRGRIIADDREADLRLQSGTQEPRGATRRRRENRPARPRKVTMPTANSGGEEVCWMRHATMTDVL